MEMGVEGKSTMINISRVLLAARAPYSLLPCAGVMGPPESTDQNCRSKNKWRILFKGLEPVQIFQGDFRLLPANQSTDGEVLQNSVIGPIFSPLQIAPEQIRSFPNLPCMLERSLERLQGGFSHTVEGTAPVALDGARFEPSRHYKSVCACMCECVCASVSV